MLSWLRVNATASKYKSLPQERKSVKPCVQIECGKKPLTSYIPLLKAVSTTLHMPILTHVYYDEWIHMAVNLAGLPSVLTAECLSVAKILGQIDVESREK